MRGRRKNLTGLLHCALCILLIILVSACGEATHSSSETGSIAFSLELRGAPQQSSGRYTAALDCAAAGVSTVEANVYDENDSKLASGGPWPCEAHQGTITGVPAGSNRKVVILARDSSGNVRYRGEKTGITVIAGQTTSAGTITLVPSVPSGASLAAGSYHTVTIKTDSTLWAWGLNDYGQLGDGTNENKNSPIQIGAETNWASVAAGEAHTVAVKTDGTLWAWGYNDYGQLGDGTNSSKNSPVQIGAETNWASVAAGEGHTVAVKTDGTLWAWGLNDYGQLGDQTNKNKNNPIQIGTDTNWASVAAGRYHSVAVKTDDTLWTWGYNDEGQLGDGSAWYENPANIP